MKKYEKHPSIIKIKEKMKNRNMSFFSFVTKKTVLSGLRDTPFKMIRENLDIVSNFVYSNFNDSLFSSNFLSHLKNANITPLFKNKERANVENYRIIYDYLNKIL